MDRIYQGKVTAAELFAGKDDQGGPIWEKLDNWQDTLWQHHKLFQDAVNYYVIALLALAEKSNGRVFPIRQRLAELDTEGKPTDRHVWTQVRRRGVTRPGMRESVAPHLGLDSTNASPEDCFKVLLEGNDSESALLDLALRELLSVCAGDGAIQQKGREMLPRFCDSAYAGNYPYSKTSLAKAASKEEIPKLLYSPDAADNIEALSEKLDFASFANTNPKAEPFSGDGAKAKLDEALNFVASHYPKVEKYESILCEKIKGLPPTTTFPAYRGGSINKDALKLRFYSYLLFTYVEQSDLTFTALRDSFPQPAVKKSKSTKAKNAKASEFLKYGDDPINLARGKRGYVFPAFTSLPAWGGQDQGKPLWKEFDIAAFKEALKILHQIEAKAEERDSERRRLEYYLDCMHGRCKWKPKPSDEKEESPLPTLKGDPRIGRLEAILDSDLAQEYEFTEGEPVSYGLQARTIRGFRELRRTWNRIAPEGTRPSDLIRQRLVDSLRAYQRDNANSVGSIRLYEELLKPDNWVIWQEPSLDTQASWRKENEMPSGAEFAEDPVTALTDALRMEREIERLQEPIRFTPADPQYSRRQFYFPNLSERGKHGHERNSESMTVPLVRFDGVYKNQRVRLYYSAPRLRRDRLRQREDENLQSAPFLQPMMEALGLSDEMLQDIRKHAVALMPEVLPSGDKRILLNFPIKLDTASLIERLGKQKTWRNQFAAYNDQNFYLRWPSQVGSVKRPTSGWWWEIVGSFSCMSVDLGQRDAGAFAVLNVRSNHDFQNKPSWNVGSTDGKTWRAAVSETGLLRLPGEDAKVFRDGVLQTEFSGEKGRMADLWEWEEAVDIARKLGPDQDPQRFVGDKQKAFSFPEQNDGLLRCLRWAQGRLARMQSLSWRLLDKGRAEEAIKEVEENDEFNLLIEGLPAPKEPELVAQAIHDQLKHLRETVQIQLVRLANRILPLQSRSWEWVKRPDSSGCYVLRRTAHNTENSPRKIMGQRGLSLERIKQIQELRRRAQALNRALMQQPGVKPVLGRAARGIELPDPCPEILDKLEQIKEQRVNQTAHLILARALGLRLKPAVKDRIERIDKDIHGEYEAFRPPVDFIVLEDLSRYLSSQGRAPAENSRVMQWCHRALLHKLKELCEPYGLPVVEAAAAYSSRFCSRSGVAGFRAKELSPAAQYEWYWQNQLSKLDAFECGESRPNDDKVKYLQHLRAFFDALQRVNEGRSGEKPRTLIVPSPGGPIFVPARGATTQADINAAINIGLRAIAAPDCHSVHVRIRSRFENGAFSVRTDTRREQARWENANEPIHLVGTKVEDLLLSSRNPNFFVDHGKVARYDRASMDGLSLPVASGRGVWGTLRQLEWPIANRLNNDRLEKWGLGRPLEEQDGAGKENPHFDIEEDIPM